MRRLVQKMGLRILPIPLETGLVAEIIGRLPGKTVAIRTDIDALPISEQTKLPFKSKIPGRMHACGHDVHMAVVLGVAALLEKGREKLHGRVRFLFQPAEEMPPGGAQVMIEQGAIEGVRMIFGLHVDSTLPVGKIGLRDGATMASVTDFDIIVRGKAGHAAKPHTGVDAIAVAAEIVEAIQKVVSRETDPAQPVVVTFGTIHGGVARNVIADEVVLQGTARTLSKSLSKQLPQRIRKIAVSIAKAHGATAEMNIIAGYPILHNTPHVNRLLAREFEALFGKGKIAETEPSLGGEDFARYLEHIPGAMFRLGVGNKNIGADKPWHSPYFMVDEQAIFYGTALLTATVFGFTYISCAPHVRQVVRKMEENIASSSKNGMIKKYED